MTRKWGRTEDWIERFLCQRDGNLCQICNREQDAQGATELIIEHKDNDPTNYSPENLRLAHHSCNIRKNPRGPVLPQNALPHTRKRERIRYDEDPDHPLDSDPFSNRVAHSARPAFRRAVFNKTLAATRFCQLYSKRSVLAQACEIAGVETETGSRYLERMLSESGPLDIIERNGVQLIIFRHPKYCCALVDELMEMFPVEGQRFADNERKFQLEIDLAQRLEHGDIEIDFMTWARVE